MTMMFRTTVLLMVVGVMHGCGSVTSGSESSPVERMDLSGFVRATSETTVTTRFGPSLADTRVVKKGFTVLSDEGIAALRAAFDDWAPTERTAVPQVLMELLPEGDILVSQRCNESFTKNKKHTYGFVVLSADESSNRICYMATDGSHPLD
jgi:hypothetical protein